LLGWLVCIAWVPTWTVRAVMHWPSCARFAAQHWTAWRVSCLLVQVILNLACVMSLSRKHPSCIWIPRPEGRRPFAVLLLILLPLLLFHLCSCFRELQAIADAATLPHRTESTELIGSLLYSEWHTEANGPNRTDFLYASIMTFIAPVAEEFLFNGFLLNVIAKAYGFVAAVLAVPLCFTFWHALKYGVGVICPLPTRHFWQTWPAATYGTNRGNHFDRALDPPTRQLLPRRKRALVPEPTDEVNRCDLRHLTPKVLQKAL
jgi:membrane protease YdiL (CAAX protease family)